MKPHVKVTIYLPPDVARALRVEAAESKSTKHPTTMSEIVQNALLTRITYVRRPALPTTTEGEKPLCTPLQQSSSR